ncbi:MAG: hypothetical protein DRI98_11580 [Bacteroidetes bacterium]|nr:MAG: hypothetical protein DRI98_11580 [Bacteroidota bacterium]
MLGDGNTNMFVRGYVYDNDNKPFTGSPFNMPHVGNGVYQFQSDLLKFPGDGVFEVRAEYGVWEDALYTKKAPYLNTLDIFRFQNVLAESEISSTNEINELRALEINNGRTSSIRVNIDQN